MRVVISFEKDREMVTDQTILDFKHYNYSLSLPRLAPVTCFCFEIMTRSFAFVAIALSFPEFTYGPSRSCLGFTTRHWKHSKVANCNCVDRQAQDAY